MAKTNLSDLIRQRDARMRQALYDELNAVISDAQLYHFRVTSDWTNQPDFRRISYRSATLLRSMLVIAGQSEIFRYVDEGTGSHGPRHHPYSIVPKKPGGMLKFRLGYAPRTQPVARFAVGPGRAFGAWVQKPYVLHPGIKPRRFTETYVDKLRPHLIAQFERALSQVK